MRLIICVPVAMILLAGCGASAPGTSSKLATTSKQAASIVAGHKQEILDAIAYEDSCVGECQFPVNFLKRYQKIASMAGALYDELEAAKPFADEVSGLVTRSQSTLKKVLDTWSDFQRCTDTHAGESIDACGSQWSANEAAWRALKPMLAMWSPYGV